MGKVLVTGGSGFIGSHVCDRLIQLGHEVVCYDNLLTSSISNIQHLMEESGFEFLEHDIRDSKSLKRALEGCTHVTHQAALGSVPRSIDDPVRTNDINLVGGLNVLNIAKDEGVSRFVFASSSSVYGDDPNLPKKEEVVGDVMSPYAASKAAFESYAKVFSRVHGMETIGMRYFNVFGPRQSPDGPYAAVIPKFLYSLSEGERPKIFGDGLQTRDFTYVENVVNANIDALFGNCEKGFGKSFNVAFGKSISIISLFEQLKERYEEISGRSIDLDPEYFPERTGDVKDSLADLSNVKECLGYEPMITTDEGLSKTTQWFIENRG